MCLTGWNKIDHGLGRELRDFIDAYSTNLELSGVDCFDHGVDTVFSEELTEVNVKKPAKGLTVSRVSNGYITRKDKIKS